jgi:hypothetical protein
MTDELDLLRRHRSEPTPASDEARAGARQSLEHAIGREQLAPGRPVRHKRARPRRRLLAGAALAVALASLSIAVGASLRSGSSTEPALAAGPLLEQLARIASIQPSAIPGPNQYLYTASHSLTASDTELPGGIYCQVVFQEYRQNWIAANGEGLFRESDGPAHYLSAREAAACKAAPAQPAGESDTWAAPGCLSIDPIPLGRLPRDPTRLRERLLTGKVEGGPPGPAEAFTQVGDLLRETDAPPALRAALYRAAAGLPGVKSLGTVTDQLGRHGLGLAFDSHGTRHELIFSATTSALLAEQDVLVGRIPGVDAVRGTVLGWSTYSAGRVVDRLPAASPLALTPPCVRGGGTGLSVPGQPRDSVIVGFRTPAGGAVLPVEPTLHPSRRGAPTRDHRLRG